MKHFLWILLVLTLIACGSDTQNEANKLLNEANALYESHQYDQALSTIDSLRRVFPGAIDTRKKALALLQTIELKRSQEELALVDSLLQAVSHDYEYQKQKVEKDKQALRATADELTMLTRTRIRRDSLQTRWEALGAKIKYIRKKQKEL